MKINYSLVANQDLSLPAKLCEPGLTKKDLVSLVKKVKENQCTPTNPVPLEVKDFRQLYSEVW